MAGHRNTPRQESAKPVVRIWLQPDMRPSTTEESGNASDRTTCASHRAGDHERCRADIAGRRPDTCSHHRGRSRPEYSRGRGTTALDHRSADAHGSRYARRPPDVRNLRGRRTPQAPAPPEAIALPRRRSHGTGDAQIVTAGQALVGIVGIALLVLAATGLHTLQLRLERWASNRPPRQGRRVRMRELFAMTALALLTLAVAYSTAASAKGFPGDRPEAAQHRTVDRVNGG